MTDAKTDAETGNGNGTSKIVSPSGSPNRDATHPGAAKGFSKRDAALTLGALGVVYGDIGTSPLYAVRQSVLATSRDVPQEAAVFGAISLIFWALMLIVTVKYVMFILRADNKGEGGILALAALAHRSPGIPRWVKTVIASAAIVGLALFFGEGLLTPAISVLSAVEGLRVEEPAFGPFILPLALIILLGLFSVQSRGTGKIGFMFGPIIVIWFVALGILGAASIFETPRILLAFNPYYAIHIFSESPWNSFVALGAVVLAVTGVEALYADLGHFGRKAIRIAWVFVALPGLLLNYLGQGALLLRNPEALDAPFFELAPEWFHYGLVLLATMAAIIASQAVISGVYSLVSQAVQLGQLPRMEIRHTSATEYGQIYIPRANSLMLLGVVLIVIIFRSSDALAAAYGMAVTGLMTITSLMALIIATNQWRWKPIWLFLAFGTFIFIDLTFLSSVSLKLLEGAWLPLAMAGAIYSIMYVWRSGRRVFMEKTYGGGLSMAQFLERADKTPLRVAGTAIFVTPRLDEVPGSLLHNLKHNKVLHERIILLRVNVTDVPFVPDEKRLTVEKLGKGFFTVEAHFGFIQTPDVPRALENARAFGLAVDLETTTFFIRRETLVPARRSAMPRWRTKLFIKIYASALEAAQFYRLPPGRVVELGSQTEI